MKHISMKYLVALVVVVFLGACSLPTGEKYLILLKPSSTDPKLIQLTTDILSKRLETAYKDKAVARVKGAQIEIELHEKVSVKEFLPLVLTRGAFTLHETFSDVEIVQRILKIDPGAKQFSFLRVDPSRRQGIVGETGLQDTSVVMQSPTYKALKNQYDDMDLMWGKETTQWTTELYAIKKSDHALTNVAVESAKIDFDMQGKESVFVVLKKEYHEAWLSMTRANLSRAIAICLDNHVISAPIVAGEIQGGRLSISGGQEGDARMLAAIIGSDVLPLSLVVSSVDPALMGTKLSHPTAEQIERYNVLQKEYLNYRHQIDSIFAMSPANVNTTTVRREFGRIYYQDLPTIVAETKMSEGQVDMFLEKAYAVLSSFKTLLDPEGKSQRLSESFFDSLSSGE